MRDALGVGRSDGICERDGDRQQIVETQAAFRNRQSQRPPLNQLHRQEQERIGLLDRVHGDDVRVVQRGGRARFPLEPPETIRISETIS